jgi:hypothetical protein
MKVLGLLRDEEIVSLCDSFSKEDHGAVDLNRVAACGDQQARRRVAIRCPGRS